MALSVLERAEELAREVGGVPQVYGFDGGVQVSIRLPGHSETVTVYWGDDADKAIARLRARCVREEKK